MQIHARPGVFQKAGEFPDDDATDLPLSDDARQFYKSGLPLLQRHLPLWLAVLIQQLAFTLLPLAAVAYPVLRIVPAIYGWGVPAAHLHALRRAQGARAHARGSRSRPTLRAVRPFQIGVPRHAPPGAALLRTPTVQFAARYKASVCAVGSDHTLTEPGLTPQTFSMGQLHKSDPTRSPTAVSACSNALGKDRINI